MAAAQTGIVIMSRRRRAMRSASTPMGMMATAPTNDTAEASNPIWVFLMSKRPLQLPAHRGQRARIGRRQSQHSGQYEDNLQPRRPSGNAGDAPEESLEDRGTHLKLTA